MLLHDFSRGHRSGRQSGSSVLPGYTKEKLIGNAVSMIYAPESHSKMRDLLEKWKKTGRLESEEIVVLTREGERRSCSLAQDR